MRRYARMTKSKRKGVCVRFHAVPFVTQKKLTYLCELQKIRIVGEEGEGGEDTTGSVLFLTIKRKPVDW